jgi:hypothetical protein
MVWPREDGELYSEYGGGEACFSFRDIVVVLFGFEVEDFQNSLCVKVRKCRFCDMEIAAASCVPWSVTCSRYQTPAFRFSDDNQKSHS